MNKTFTIVFTFITVISIIEVLTDPTKSHEDVSDEDSFHEFDSEAPDYKYTKEANEPIADSEEEQPDEDIEIRAPSGTGSEGTGKIKTPMNMPPIRFSYCISCGYRQAFEQFSQIIQEKYPGVLIEGTNYPPTYGKAFLSQFIGIGKIVLIVMILSGRDPFPSLGMATPAAFNWMVTNKLSACLMLFMLSNTIEGMLMSTGAFEIYLGNNLIWSKLESGRVPSPLELIQAIDSQLAIEGDTAKIGTGFGAGFDNIE